MYAIEKLCVKIRHNSALRNAAWIWNVIRPVYNRTTAILGRNGLERTINGTDTLRLLPEYRGVPETYEPDIWPQLMASIRPGDTVVDVGAFIGLYTIAFANRVGRNGRVVAFEPSRNNYIKLERHIKLNGIIDTVQAVRAAVGDESGAVTLEEAAVQSSVSKHPNKRGVAVPAVTLDEYFPDTPVHVLKIDVEGFEELVLLGSRRLLADPARAPRKIFVEVHPYAWEPVGTTGKSLLGILRRHGYTPCWPNGSPISEIASYGEIVASKCRL